VVSKRETSYLLSVNAHFFSTEEILFMRKLSLLPLDCEQHYILHESSVKVNNPENRDKETKVSRPGGDYGYKPAKSCEACNSRTSAFWVIRHGRMFDEFIIHDKMPNKVSHDKWNSKHCKVKRSPALQVVSSTGLAFEPHILRHVRHNGKCCHGCERVSKMDRSTGHGNR